ncbi:MAG TPA: hemerythrin domain-containing protein [Methylocystis sp.]|jgi:hemerythrin superfamily protein
MARQSEERENENIPARTQEKTGDGERQKADAIEMLKADHRRVQELFDKFELAKRRAEKSKLAQQICLELTIHTELEEEIFYPACREHVDDLILDEAQVEHDTAKILTAEIAMSTPQSDPFFDAKVIVLAEYMRKHIREEESGDDSIFAKAREGGVDTAALGERMMKRREELMEQFSEELLLPQPKTLHIQLAQEEEVWAEPPGRAGRGREAQGRGREQGRESWEGRRGEEGWGSEEEERAYDERRSARGGGREEEGRGWRGEAGEAWQGRRGWEEREGGEARASRGRDEERGGHPSHRGWHGDPKRHSEASRRGWEHRR